MAAAGSAVGLGNIWRFPYETGENGGAAFLLIYLFWMVLIGFPIMVGEITIGRNTKLNAYGAYKSLGGKKWAMIGVWGLISAMMFLSVYNVVAGWAFAYFIQTITGALKNVDNFGAHFAEQISDVSDLFFFSLGFMILTAFIVAKGIKGGIEKASKILMPTLFALLIILIIYSLTLDNAMSGVKYYLVPDLSEINFSTVYSALGQAFFSLSIGMAGMVTYGSYISKKENLIASAGLVVTTDTLVAFLAGLLIFPLVFSQGLEPSEGPGLVFVVLPGIFNSMGAVGLFVGSMFFLLLCFAALTSTIALLEIPVTFLVDEKRWSRKWAVTGVAITVFLIGIPSMLSQGAVDSLTNFMYYEGTSKSVFDVVFDVFSDIGLPLGGFLMTIFITLRWRLSNFDKEISIGNNKYLGSFLNKYIDFTISFLAPLILGTMFIAAVLKKFFDTSLF